MRRPLIALLGLTAACGSVGTARDVPTTPVPTPPPTVVGVGALPDTVPRARALRDEPLVVITRPVTREGVLVELVGDRVGGNRLLLVGDSIFAGAARRYGGEMCAGLVPLGWEVAVEAEAGRFVEFGNKVVKRLVPEADDSTAASDAAAGDEDWDAAGVFLGSNYDGNRANFDEEMRAILDRLAPRPTLLYTVTEYRPAWADVNDVIRQLADDYSNVTVIDWEEISRTPGILMSDGLHPGDEGEQVLVDLTAAALGRAQVGEGECLRETFRDDSAISDATVIAGGSGSGSSGGSSSGSSSGGSSGTRPPRTTSPATTSPRTTTPSPPRITTPGTTSPGSTSPGTTSPGTTSPGSTSPPSTSPGSTSPPSTSPPTTSPPPPPPTAPPTTKPVVTAPPVTSPPVTAPPTTLP